MPRPKTLLVVEYSSLYGVFLGFKTRDILSPIILNSYPNFEALKSEDMTHFLTMVEELFFHENGEKYPGIVVKVI